MPATLGGIVAAAMLMPIVSMADASVEEFKNPPMSARPRVWWHWMGGNITAEGAALDLEWMKRIGLGGVHVFSGAMGDLKVVPEPVPFMSSTWQQVFRQSLETTRRAGMELTIAGSPGWSQTGGPWVAPADAMKKYVWSESHIEGGRPFRGLLERPPTTSGPFLGASLHAKPGETMPELYKDSFVVAFRTPAAEVRSAQPAFTTGAGTIDLSPIARGDLANVIKLPIVAGTRSAWVQMQYAKPTEVSALTLAVASPVVAGVEVQVSEDGQQFRSLMQTAPRAINTIDVPGPQRMYAFSPTVGKLFRVVLTAPPPPEPLPGLPKAFPRAKPATEFAIMRLQLETGARLDHFEAKAGFEPTIGSNQDTPQLPADSRAIIRNSQVFNLTSRMSADGRLDWTPPPGEWTVLRFGYSLTGHKNGPAESGATGLEVDKLDPEAVKRYLDAYLDMYASASGGQLGPNGVEHLLTDSWEAGVQNWTPKFVDAFRALRGYDPLPYFPVLAGRIVESIDTSERFLWDFRQTLKDRVADSHHGVIAKELRARGMGYYSEAQGDTPRAIADGMTLKARSDVPTAEYWYRPFATAPGQPSLKADLEEAASAAHVYGKPFAAAEALTVAAGDDRWGFSPAMLKPVADEIFARGINRILIHESHLQPLIDKKPGLTLSIFGQFFTRNETWAEHAKPWIDYLARTSYLLQQGQYIADIAYFYGEEKNLTELFRDRFNTDVPPGYRYDYINPEALLTRLSVKDGRIVTPSGMSYRILYMPAHVTRYTLPALRKVRELVSAGAVIVGPKPTGGLGLAGSDDDVRAIAQEVWGQAPSRTSHAFGHGRVYETSDLAPVLAAEKIAADVSFSGAASDARLLTTHRRSGESDIYFISNQQARPETVEVTFRVTGSAPELWRAETASIEKLSYRLDGDGVSTPLKLDPHEAVFIVFRRKAEQKEWTAPKLEEALTTVDGPWSVSFESGRGAPPTATFDQLVSWPDIEAPGIRYFSGGATYSKQIKVATGWLAGGKRVHLDLGTVHELATVMVNGKPVGTAWHAPYRLDITDALRRGENKLEIKVVNLWPNRLIGDKQPGATPVTFAPQSPYNANSPLLPSGLLGPVQLIGVSETKSSSVHE
ncbi:glycosyl hydrolase [Steroidobacter flavus]